MAAAALMAAPARAQLAGPIEIHVVIVTTWEDVKDGKDGGGELYNWQKKWPLNINLPFAMGEHPLQYDPATHVLAVVTGEATARAAASITALGLDPRFDLSHAYWILAGTAGVDPKVASAGSAAWERWVVDGDLAQELDPRDMPADWPTGIVPYGRTQPYETPTPAAMSQAANVAFTLNRKLVDWAYAKSKAVPLKDDANERKLRAPYAGPGAKPPFVLEGDGLMSARSWYGPQLNQWAERWVDYWTQGQGVFAMSAEEDTGVMQALTQLAQGGHMDINRVLLLRAASDYTIEPTGVSAADFLAKETKEGFPATPEALDSLYAVASPVAKALTTDWVHTRDTIPGGP